MDLKWPAKLCALNWSSEKANDIVHSDTVIHPVFFIAVEEKTLWVHCFLKPTTPFKGANTKMVAHCCLKTSIRSQLPCHEDRVYIRWES